MPTATAPKPRRKAAAPAGRVRLTLTINGVDYRIRPIPDGSTHAWELRKADGCTYHVQWADGTARHACTCGDFTWRRGHDAAGCKHLRALAALDLI